MAAGYAEPDPRVDLSGMCRPFQVGEARDRLVGVEIAAGRDPQAPRIAAEIHVHLPTARFEPDEAEQVAAVRANRVDVGVRAAYVRVERSGNPTRAVNGSMDAVRQLLPAGAPRRRA